MRLCGMCSRLIRIVRWTGGLDSAHNIACECGGWKVDITHEPVEAEGLRCLLGC